MKKLLIAVSFSLFANSFAQFNVTVAIPAQLADSDAYLYGFNGSKEILYSKAKTNNNVTVFKVDKQYVGMMRAFFKNANSSVNMVSENKDINLKIEVDSKNKISNVVFQDKVNEMFSNDVEIQKKQELILPALIQIKDYYNAKDNFYKALESEISLLSNNNIASNDANPFLSFYQKNLKFSQQEKTTEMSSEDFINFFAKSGQYLETSTLMKPALINFLNVSKSNVEGGVDKLLAAVNLETPRGQTILSELIEIFSTYGMDKLKDKYLAEANGLKCTINDRLASTIKANKNTAIGAKLPNTTFTNVIHTKAKSLYDVKAAKKIVVFWSSTCSHCEAELPKLLEKYDQLKAQNIEIVGFSLDNNLDEFRSKANLYPWINDSEGKGWYSSYGEIYNVVATPTYFVVDANNVIISKPNHVGDVLDYLKVN